MSVNNTVDRKVESAKLELEKTIEMKIDSIKYYHIKKSIINAQIYLG